MFACLSVCFVCLLFVCLFVCWLLVDCWLVVGLLVDLGDCLVGWVVGLLDDWLVSWLAGRLVGWLLGWVGDRFVGWVVSSLCMLSACLCTMRSCMLIRLLDDNMIR